MLYDIDKTLHIVKENRRNRDFCDLVYDVESYIIDLMYVGGDRLSETALSQEIKGRAKLSNLMMSEKERENAFSVLCEVMCELGVPRQIKGFRLLCDCILEAVKEKINNRPYYLMNIYPVLSQKYRVSVNNAEKLCRYACNYINISRSIIAKYPCLEVLTRRSYESITLKETVEVMTSYVIKNCKIKTRGR